MKESKPLTKLWKECRQLIEENRLEEAEQKLERCILFLARTTFDGVGDKDMIEGVKKETWLERFWIATENHIWPTRPDYEKNWKMS